MTDRVQSEAGPQRTGWSHQRTSYISSLLALLVAEEDSVTLCSSFLMGCPCAWSICAAGWQIRPGNLMRPKNNAGPFLLGWFFNRIRVPWSNLWCGSKTRQHRVKVMRGGNVQARVGVQGYENCVSGLGRPVSEYWNMLWDQNLPCTLPVKLLLHVMTYK